MKWDTHSKDSDVIIEGGGTVAGMSGSLRYLVDGAATAGAGGACPQGEGAGAPVKT